MIDALAVPILAIGTLILARQLGFQGAYPPLWAAAVVFALEPGLVAATGGTLGHHLSGIRVRRRRDDGNVGIIAAVVRSLAKVVFGLPSLASILVTTQHRAVHDVLAGSIVVLSDPGRMPAFEVLGETTVAPPKPGYACAPGWQQAAMILVYNILLFLFIGSVSAVSVSERCDFYQQCSTPETALYAGLSILWILGFVASIVLCWRGKLFGCRRRLKAG